MAGIEGYSVTAANNNSASPNGWPEGMAPSGVNDSDRQFAAAVRAEFATTSLTATATISIGNNAAGVGATIHICTDANKSISCFDTIAAGIRRTLIFDVAATLVHDATKLKIPGARSLALVAGDAVQLVSEGAGNWQVFAFTTGAEVPAGVTMDFAGTAAPTGWLQCDGSNVSRTTYARLFAAISTTWGVGDGATTFGIPDFRRRIAVGSGGSGSSTLAATVGSTGGEETHVLTIGELASHTHTSPSDVFLGAGGAGVAGGSGRAVDAGPTTTTGSSTAHNNVQPSCVVLKIIKI